jgi:aminodeoxyfutalosine synthase
MNSRIEDVAARLAAGRALEAADVAELAGITDILTLGMLADEARRRRHGAQTTFVRVFEMPRPAANDDVPPVPPGAGEIRIGGPIESFDDAVGALRRIVASAGGVPVAAWTVDALEAHATATGQPIASLFAAMRDAGVASVTAAALDVMTQPERSLEALKASGLELGTLTVRHTASTAVRLAHIVRARSLQQSIGWIGRFAPLGESWPPGEPSTGYDDVRQVALARLLIDNVESIQVDWLRYGPKLAQVALTVGADDIDGVSPFDDTGEGRRRAPLEEIRRNILAAGLVPVERDGTGRAVTS